MEFETTDAAMRGEMMATFTPTDAGGGKDVLAVQDNVPPGISLSDNETGWQMALDKLHSSRRDWISNVQCAMSSMTPDDSSKPTSYRDKA